MSSTRVRSAVVRFALVACVNSACAPVVGGAQAPARQPSATTDVVYGHKDGLALTFDVHRPSQPNTRRGGGNQTPVAERRENVTILDIYQNAASAKIDASGWVDYLHLAKWNGRWVIINVLWELHPQKAP